MLWAALGAAFCIATAGATPSDAQETTLSFKDGSFEVTGPLLGFDGQAYRIDTRFGVLTIKAAQVTCQGACPGRGDTQIVRMVGSPAMAEVLMPALIDAFARSLGLSSTAVQSALPGEVTLEIRGSAGEALVRYSIRGGGSEAGFAALAAGEADIVLADRDATPLERAMLLETGLGDMASPLRRRLIARRLFRLVVPAGFPAPSLSVGQVLEAAQGAVRWSDLGGPDTEFALAARGEDVAPLRARLAELAARAELPLGDLALSEVADGDGLVQFLSEREGAAVLTHETIFSGRPVSLSHGCEPGSANRATGDAHPLMVHLWAYTAAPRLPDLGRAFLIFAGGPEAQRVVDRAGFIDQRPRPIPLADQGERIARAVVQLSADISLSELQGAIARIRRFDRLSTVFRFEPGSPGLTRESENEAQSLAAILDAGRFDGRELLFLGMTDSIGAASVNAELAQGRAARAMAQVRRSMATRQDRVIMNAEGLGEVFPLACDDAAWGQHVNRRVEVWLGPPVGP